MRESLMKLATKKEIEEIKEILVNEYKDAKTELIYSNEYELLIAIMLSAQCTDKRVNIITPALFEKYPSVQELSIANIDDIKALINTCSFFNNKAVNLHKMANQVINDYEGKIPTDEKQLVKLAGVGVKTANVFMIEFFQKNLMAVDTHVFRTSHRLGLSKAKTTDKTMEDLCKKLKDDLYILHQAFVLFGRYICKAKNPDCDKCILIEYCKSKDSFKV
jgi:endonuclease-3